MKGKIALITIIFIVCFSTFNLRGQDDGISPQIWNNVFVGWNISNKFVLRNAAAFNIRLSNEAPWNEITYSVSGVYKIHRFYEVNAGLYFARSRQSKDLKSYELRPFVGFRVATNTEKRWYVTNLSRFESRWFTYSDGDHEWGFRFRNRTYGIVSLNQPTMSDDQNLYLFGYFEFFYSFGIEVRERYFDQLKYKVGFGYRLSLPWRFDIGIIYQDAKNTTGEVVPYDANIITRFIIEWGVAYIIGPRKKN